LPSSEALFFLAVLPVFMKGFIFCEMYDKMNFARKEELYHEEKSKG